jgi:hypothetical protein
VLQELKQFMKHSAPSTSLLELSISDVLELPIPIYSTSCQLLQAQVQKLAGHI